MLEPELSLKGGRTQAGYAAGHTGLPERSKNEARSVLSVGRDLEPVDARGRVLLFCSDPDGRCPFSRRRSPTEGLPVLTVDEEICRLTPALVISSVDKLAQLPWKGGTAPLFGLVTTRCPRHGWQPPDTAGAQGRPQRHRGCRPDRARRCPRHIQRQQPAHPDPPAPRRTTGQTKPGSYIFTLRAVVTPPAQQSVDENPNRWPGARSGGSSA